MTGSNLTLAQKIDLLRTAPLGNTDYVIIEGNPDDGWTLVNWNGQLFSPEPTLGAEVRRQLRTLNRQLADSVKQFFDSFASRDFATIATAFNRSVADAVYSIAKYHRAVHAKVINDLDKIFGRPATDTSSDVSALAANPDAEQDIAAADTAAAAESSRTVTTVESETATAAVAPEVTSTREVSEAPAGDSDTNEDTDIKEDAQATDEDPKDDHAKEEDVKDDADALTDSTEDASDRDDDTADRDDDTADRHDDTGDEGSAGKDTSDRSGADSADGGYGSKGGDTDSGSTRDAA